MAKEQRPQEAGNELENPRDEELKKALEKLEREYFEKIERMKKDAEQFLSIDEAIETYLNSFENGLSPETDPPDKDN